MSNKGILVTLISAAVFAGVGTGCQHNQNARSQPQSPATGGPLQVMSPEQWEWNTVEMKEPSDKDQAQTQMRQQLAKFQEEGWSILSISAPQPQPDGTIIRKYSLRRAKR